MKMPMPCIWNSLTCPLKNQKKLPLGSLDYDASNQVVGIEFLYLSKRPHPVNLMDFQFETRPKKLRATRYIAPSNEPSR